MDDSDTKTAHCERYVSSGELEITPEMIEAGVAALVSYNPKFDLEEDGARRIFAAMVRAKHPVAAKADSHPDDAPSRR
jgi:hypothetical protein